MTGNVAIVGNVAIAGNLGVTGYVGINKTPSNVLQLDVSGNANVSQTFEANAMTLTASNPVYNNNSVVTVY